MIKKPIIVFNKDERKKIISHLQDFFNDSLEIELRNLQGELLLDYITEKIGQSYYNKGIEKSMEYMLEKTDELYLLMEEN